MNGYGALNWDDVRLLEAAISLASTKGAVSFLEVGVHNGETAEGIKRFCDERRIALIYTGIDVVEPPRCPPFEGAKFIKGLSEEVFKDVDVHNIVMIDACHCYNHVMLDILNYHDKVSQQGFMLFHDTSPYIQGTVPDPHGPKELHCRVIKAMERVKWPFDNFVLLAETYRMGQTFGGMQLYWRKP